nr:hypothetical protein [Tobacco rattle virus]
MLNLIDQPFAVRFFLILLSVSVCRLFEIGAWPTHCLTIGKWTLFVLLFYLYFIKILNDLKRLCCQEITGG